MSTKFEQLLDLIVNEEMDKANELFHEIVVEKSRDIYENLIAEEAEEEQKEMDESEEEAEESVDEAAEDDGDDMEESVEEETDESVDLEDSYSMEADDEEGDMGGDATDDFGADVGAMDDEEGGEAGEDAAIFDIKNAIEELEAAFAKLEQAQGGEEPAGDFGDEEGEDDDMEMMGQPAFEGRRMTREYTEKVGNDWDKSGSMKGQGQYVGAGTGDKEGAPQEGRSPISSGSGKPNTGANAKNLAQSHTEGGTDKGTSPGKVNNGITKTAGEKFDAGKNGNVPGGKMGVKNLSKVAGGHGAEKKGAGPGPVGSGTGDKAGQTSIAKIPTFLKKL